MLEEEEFGGKGTVCRGRKRRIGKEIRGADADLEHLQITKRNRDQNEGR